MDKWLVIAPCGLAAVIFLCVTAIWMRKNGGKIEGKVGKDGASFSAGAEGEAKIIQHTALADAELDRIAERLGAHECLHDQDFKHFAFIMETMAASLIAMLELEEIRNGSEVPAVKAALKEATSAKVALGIRLADYRLHLESLGVT